MRNKYIKTQVGSSGVVTAWIVVIVRLFRWVMSML